VLKDPTFRASVIASVIAAVLMIFIQPLLNTLWAGILWVGTNFLVDQIYSNAALGHRQWVVVLSFVAAIFSVAISFLRRSIYLIFSEPKTSQKPMLLTTSKIFRKKIFLVGNLLILSLLAIYLSMTVFIDLQLNTSFDQRLTVLAAKVPDQKIKELRAQWAQMKTRTDYLILNESLEKLAYDAGISLPEPLLK
jgi:hypothetical protein